MDFNFTEEQQLQMDALRRAVQGREVQMATAAAARPREADVESEPVPYGEQPLSGARLERLRDMITQLKAGGFRGTLAGKFSLSAAFGGGGCCCCGGGGGRHSRFDSRLSGTPKASIGGSVVMVEKNAL